MLKTTEKSYKKCLTAWGAEINSREIDYDPEEMKRQLASGLKLQKIARNFGVCDNTLHKWRKAHGCPLQAPKRQITPELFQTFEELYQQGYRDIEIARKTTHSSMTVQKWRESRGYPQNKTPTRIIFERTYGEGCRNYSTLAEATGLSEPTMRTWVNKEIQKEASKAENPKAHYDRARKRLKDLNSNRANQEALKWQITPELFQVFEELYKQGYRDIEIAQKTTQAQNMVKKWRESRGYPPNKKPARIIFEQMYGEGCRNYSALARATGLSAATMRIWVNKEIRKEAKVSEDPKVYYRKARAKLKELNSNKVHRRLPRYRTCTIILNTADAQVPKNQAWHPTVNLANLLGVPEPEITDKDAVQAPKIEAIVQELEAMMKECRSKSKAELDTAYQGDGVKTPGKLQKALK